MLTLLNTLLSYYRLDTGKDEVDMMPFHVKDVLRTLMAEYEPLAAVKDIVIEGAFTGNDTVVMGDRKRIIQIGSNLMSNAIKFTKKGSVNIRDRKSTRLNSSHQWKHYREKTAESDVTFHLNPAAQQFCKSLGDTQSETEAFLSVGILQSVERGKDALHLLFAHACAGILHLDG